MSFFGRITVYVGAAYGYRRNSVVCPPVCPCVTIVVPTKTPEPIEMPFELWTQVGQGSMYYNNNNNNNNTIFI